MWIRKEFRLRLTADYPENGLIPVNVQSLKGGLELILPKTGAEFRRLISQRLNAFHVYILSSTIIRPNDWAIDLEEDYLFQVKEKAHAGLIRSKDNTFVEAACKKVIGSTKLLEVPIINSQDGSTDYISNVPMISKESLELIVSKNLKQGFLYVKYEDALPLTIKNELIIK